MGNGISGSEIFTGTSNQMPAKPSQGKSDITVGIKEDDFFLGQVSNLSGIDVKLSLKSGWKGSDHMIHAHDLRAYESIDIRMPLRTLNVIVNGVVIIHGMGVVVRPETQQEEAVLWANSGLLERLHDGRYYSFKKYKHTEISSITTTTLVTPADGFAIRVYKITVSTIGKPEPRLQWTDQNGVSNINVIGKIMFSGKGTFVYDFGDKGLEIPNGINGLLRLVSDNTEDIEVDVIYSEVQYQ